MKQRSAKTVKEKLGRYMHRLFLGICALLSPSLLMAQEPGSNPDIPLDMTGIPISWEMNMVFLGIAVMFAVIVIRRRAHRKHTAELKK